MLMACFLGGSFLEAQESDLKVYRIKKTGEIAAPAQPTRALGQIKQRVKPSPRPTPSSQPAGNAAVLYHWEHSHRETIRRNARVLEPGNFIDHEVLERVYKKYVTKSGWVNYRGLKRDKRTKKLLDAYVKDLSEINPDTLEDPADRMSSWLNLYNALIIQEILKHYPVTSLMQIQNFFGAPRFTVGGEKYSILDLENKVFKEKIAEPRTIFARVNGATSGSRLSREPYTAIKLEKQLEDSTWKFLTDRKNVDFDAKSQRLILNPVFLWYQEEFIDIRGFLHSYLDLLPKYYSVSYMGYDWKLNDEKLH